eukprot:SAG22_NODE_41_length_25488_cov_6.133719_7_plen_393_part_00
MKLLLLAALLAAAGADKHDGLAEPGLEGRPPSCPNPPCPSCTKTKACNGHGTCTPTVAGGTCACKPGFASPATYCDTETPELTALVLKYETMRNATCAKVVPHAPELDAADAAAFMAAYQKFACTGKASCTGSEDAVIAAAQKLLSSSALDTFFALPDSFTAADGLDATMVKCAVMTQAARGTEIGRGSTDGNLLAKFAVQGAAEEALVEKLLGDAVLMRDMLLAGGAHNSHYGEAMQIYSKLLEHSATLQAAVAAAAAVPAAGTPWDDRDPANILKRLAVAVAVAHGACVLAAEHLFVGCSFTFVVPDTRSVTVCCVCLNSRADLGPLLAHRPDRRPGRALRPLREVLPARRPGPGLRRPDNLRAFQHGRRRLDGRGHDLAAGHHGQLPAG